MNNPFLVVATVWPDMNEGSMIFHKPVGCTQYMQNVETMHMTKHILVKIMIHTHYNAGLNEEKKKEKRKKKTLQCLKLEL